LIEILTRDFQACGREIIDVIQTALNIKNMVRDNESATCEFFRRSGCSSKARVVMRLECPDRLEGFKFADPFNLGKGSDGDLTWGRFESQRAREFGLKFTGILVQNSWVQPEFSVFKLKITPGLNDASFANQQRCSARLEGL
jgi:hypothetical protein